MAKDLKPHIGIFGRRNCGKSSLINCLTGQDIAIVSDTVGTTTDPVRKSIDDVSELGGQRVEKSLKVMEEIDCAVLKGTHLKPYLASISRSTLVVTDSQLFGMVSQIVLSEVPLTSFSIVMARLRGDFDNYMRGTPQLSRLRNGDTVLLLESCTHHSTCDDIGRVKLHRMILEFNGKDILNRTNRFVSQGIPISNYGKALAYMDGIFDRVLRPFAK